MFLLILVGVTLIKIVVAACVVGTAEVRQMVVQAQAYLSGADILDRFATHGNPSFFPLGHYNLITGCFLLAQVVGIPFSFVIKLPAILADVVVSLVLKVLPGGGSRAAFLYLLNPVTFLLSAYHGQPHTVAVAAALCSLWLAGRPRWGWAGALLGFAASIRQHYAVLLVPIMRRVGWRRTALPVAFVTVLVGVNWPLITNAHLSEAFAPTWTYGSWGYTMVLLQAPRVLTLFGIHGLAELFEPLNHFLQAHGASCYWIWALAFVLWDWRRPFADLWTASLVFLLGLYAISPGFGVQWLIWALPFWLIVNRRGAVRYSILASLFLAGSYWQWSLNAKYGVGSLTANLDRLSAVDLVGAILVGACGVLTWLYCVRTVWRMART